MMEYVEVAALIGAGIVLAMYFDAEIAAALNPVLTHLKLTY